VVAVLVEEDDMMVGFIWDSRLAYRRYRKQIFYAYLLFVAVALFGAVAVVVLFQLWRTA